MKKIIALLLTLAALLTLAGCKNKVYEPVESTDEEAETVLTMTFGNKTYEVRYELYRALFLTYRDEVDGGKRDVWSGPEKDKYISEIQAIIISRAADIYSTFALAESLGIDPYSTEIGKKVNEYVNMSVDGGDINGVSYTGYESYEAYLEALEALYLNYSVQTLLFRYAIVADKIDEYYMGSLTEDSLENGSTENHDGALKYTKDDVLAFYNSDSCVRVLRTFVSEDMDLDPKSRAERVRSAILAVASGGESAVRKEMITQGSTTSVPELEAGYVIAEHNLSKSYYSAMVDAAFSIKEGELSEVIPVHDGNKMAYYVLYRTAKSAEHFEANYPAITYVYLRNEIGKQYDATAKAMISTATATDVLSSLDHSAISMK